MNSTEQEQLREINESLLLSSIHQHKLAEVAERAERLAQENAERYRAINEELLQELNATQKLQLMSSRLIEGGDTSSLYQHIVETAASVMRSDMSSMQILDPERLALRMLAYRGFDAEFGKSFECVRDDSNTSCGMALRSARRAIVPDIETFEGVAGTPEAAAQLALGIRASQSTPLFSRAGRVLGMITTHWRTPHHPTEHDLRPMDILARQAADLIERAQSEAALHHSEIRYRRLFESAKDGILILDADTGMIIDANVFMSGLLGLEPAELLGKELYQIGMFKDVEANKTAFLELQRTGYIRHENLPLQNQRGEVVEVEFIANVYAEGDRLVAQCNVRDISQRIVMERKIRQQAEALAEESHRKDEFLAMLSHELRNPLAPIRSAVHLLKINERDGESLIQRQAREIIERQVTNLTKLVSDLLEVSRVVNGRIRLDLQILDLNQVVDHALQTAAPLISQRRHKLSRHVCTNPVWIKADPTRMEEILVNLLNNAAKYTPNAGAIEVHCEHPHGENFAQLRICDNGVGLEAKMLEGGRIFDLFTQADRSLNRAAGGLGIGLSLVSRLVALHGGTVEAKSEGPGKGSEFIIRLPLVEAPAAGSHVEPPTAHVEVAGRRVLVVDDNVDLATMIVATLRHSGYSVQSAHTGPDGLKVAQQWRPDIVLLDIGLPGLDGYEVARRLRADPTLVIAGEHMRLIALTGYGRESDVALAREAGFDAHLVKPYDFDELEKLMAAST